jgi:Glycosyl hydrolases family 28/Pectate lyase superfamily protein
VRIKTAFTAALLTFWLAAGGLPAAPAAARAPRTMVYDVRTFGALGDGKTKNTGAIRKAIAAASAAGGGTIYLGAGTYLTGPIHLASNLTLYLDAGAILKFSDDFEDYLPMVRSRWEGTEVFNFSPLIYADRAENVAVVGRGTIDGQGAAWWKALRALKEEHQKTGVWPTNKWRQEFSRMNPNLEWPEDRQNLEMGFLRPPLIQLIECHHVAIEDVTIRNSPFWTVNPVYSDDVTVRGVTIDNPLEAPNTDGIDPESCRNVHISDCHISVGDDCITIKSGRDRQGRRIGRPAENITVNNCTMGHGHSGVAMGSEISGGIRKVVISNCVFEGTDRGIRIKSTRGRGGVVEDVRIQNIVMRNVREEAITLNLYYTNAPPEPLSERTPRFRNIHLSGISGTAGEAGAILGLEEARIENVTLTDVDLVAQKGLSIKDASHLGLSAVRIDTAAGPSLTIDRSDDVHLFDFRTLTPHPATPVVELSNVRRAFVHGSFAAPGTDTFLNVRGADSQSILVGENDFADVKVPVSVTKDVGPHAVQAPGTKVTAPSGGFGVTEHPLPPWTPLSTAP